MSQKGVGRGRHVDRESRWHAKDRRLRRHGGDVPHHAWEESALTEAAAVIRCRDAVEAGRAVIICYARAEKGLGCLLRARPASARAVRCLEDKGLPAFRQDRAWSQHPAERLALARLSPALHGTPRVTVSQKESPTAAAAVGFTKPLKLSGGRLLSSVLGG
jgi:hypothetical protein